MLIFLERNLRLARDFAKKFYSRKAWKRCRKSYIAQRIMIDGGMCEQCHKRPGKIVHHKRWLTPENISNPMVALNHDNLEYVCQDCHNKIEDTEYFFDSNGQLVPVDGY